MGFKPRSRHEWSAWVTSDRASKPPRLTRADYELLAPADRLAYNNARDSYHAEDVRIETSEMEAVRRSLRRTLKLNNNTKATAGHGLIIDGEPTTGKSSLVLDFGRRFERDLREQQPELFESKTELFLPFVYVAAPSEATPKSLSVRLANYLDIPEGGSQAVVTERVCRILSQCGTRLLIIDNVNNVLENRKVVTSGISQIKRFMDETPATVVCVGYNLVESPLFSEKDTGVSAAQTALRFTRQEINPWPLKTAQDKAFWQAAVKAFEMRLVLLDHKPHSLLKLWDYLYDRTQGHIGSLTKLVNEGALEAVETGAEAITRELLDDLKTHIGSQKVYDRKRALVAEAATASAKKAAEKRPLTPHS